MMKVQIVNNAAPEHVLQIKLPEDWEVLKEKLEVFGIKAEGYSICSVRSSIGIVEELSYPDVRVELLNALAIRLKRLPVFELAKFAAFCDAENHLTFRKVFCFLDERSCPGKAKELEVYLPASLGLVRTQKGGKVHQWYGEELMPDVAEGYFDTLESMFQKHLMPETGLRGLAVYLPEGKMERKVFSILPSMCRLEDGIFGCFHCQLSEWLNEAEERELKENLLHLLIFGWGRTFHYDGCAVGEGFLRLSFSGVGAKLKPLYEEKKIIQMETLPEMISVEVYPKWAKGDAIEELAEIISLPADPWTLLDWMERLRVKEESELHTTFFGSTVKAVEEYFWMEIDEVCIGGSIYAWNQLAKCLSQMDAVSLQHMEKLLQQAPQGLSVMGLLQMTEYVQTMPVLDGITSDEALGRFCVEQGSLKDKHLPDGLKVHLDYALIGKAWREKENGCYTPEGYLSGKLFFPEPCLMPVSRPLPLELLEIQFLDEKKHCQKNILLPKEKGCLTEKSWKQDIANAVFVKIFCRIPALCPVLYEDLEDVQNLIAFSEVLEELEASGEMVRYKALLELLAAPDLNMVIHQKELLEQYFFYEDCRTFEEAGCRFFEEISGRRLMEEEKESIRFRDYGKRMLLKAGGVETSYGYVIPKPDVVCGKE